MTSANEGEGNDHGDNAKTDAFEDYDDDYDYPDIPEFTAREESKIPKDDADAANFAPNSTMEEYDYYDNDYDHEEALKERQAASPEITLVPTKRGCGEAGPSKVLTLLNSDEIDPEQLSMDELMGFSNEKAILDCLRIVNNTDVLKKLALVLPATALGAIIARPDLVKNLSDETIITFASVPKVVNSVNISILLDVANRRPHIIGKVYLFLLCLGSDGRLTSDHELGLGAHVPPGFFLTRKA